MSARGGWFNESLNFKIREKKLSPLWHGRMIIQPDGTFMYIMTQAGRTAPVTEEDRAAAFNTVFAASGFIKNEGNRSIVTTELASHPRMIGVAHVTREYIGERLRSTGDWAPSLLLGNRIARAIIEWERE